MSHFTVLVITSEQPTNEVLEKTLMPWHEYECTGLDNEYVVDVDVTDKVLEHFNEEQNVVVLADGSIHSCWDDKFYTKKPDPKEVSGRNEFELPEGAVEKTISADVARSYKIGPKTMREAATDYYGDGIKERDGKFYKRTNEDKWSWIDAERQEVGRTAGDAALPHMRQGHTTGLFLFGEGNQIEPARKVLVLQGMHAGEELSAATCTTPTMAPSAEVWVEPINAQNATGQAEGEMRDLPRSFEAGEADGSGSLSHHTRGAGDFVPELQSSSGKCEGQPQDTQGSYQVHNPISKALIGGSRWDWWSLGGRWRGMLLTKDGSGSHGEPGAFDNGSMRPGGVDACQMKNLDIEAMRNDAEKQAAERFDKFHAVLAGRTLRPFKAPEEGAGPDAWDEARKTHWGQDGLKELSAAGFHFDLEEYLVPREQFLATARAQALSTFAVVKDGKWYARGEMGWWGSVSDEKNKEQWVNEFAKLIDGLSPDAWVAVVDCHI